jgi:hypothetical protein
MLPRFVLRASVESQIHLAGLRKHHRENHLERLRLLHFLRCGGGFAVMDGSFEGEHLLFRLVGLDWHVAGEVGWHDLVRIAVIDSI